MVLLHIHHTHRPGLPESAGLARRVSHSLFLPPWGLLLLAAELALHDLDTHPLALAPALPPGVDGAAENRPVPVFVMQPSVFAQGRGQWSQALAYPSRMQQRRDMGPK